MLNVSVNTTPDNTVHVQWDTGNGAKPSGYLIKWNEKEQQVVTMYTSTSRLTLL